MKIFRYGIIVAATALLAACGGSSSGSFDNGGSASLTITSESSEVAQNATVQITVRFRNADGSTVSDGTEVTLNSSNTNLGEVAAVDDPSAATASATAATGGGVANFWFTAGTNSTGTVTLTASADNPSGAGTVSASININVIEDPDAVTRLSIEGSNTMPANPAGVGIFLGSPFINELTLRYRNADGSAGSVADGEFGVAVSPVSRGAFSTLDDPETDDVNEFFVLLGNGPVSSAAGVATIFVHSFDQPGPLTVTVSAQDATTGDTFSQDFVIEIEEGGADFLPANIDFQVPPAPVYIQGSGGANTKSASVFVSDSGDNAVPNPEDGEFNNVTLSLEAPAGSGASLTGTGANGSVSGNEISVRTVNGIANFSLNAGSVAGEHVVTATVDRADNNVDNDLVDPLTAQTTINVGDGRLFSLEIVSPEVNAIAVNRIVGGIQTEIEPEIDPETGILVPPDPDGTYSLTITSQGSDQAGNPVLLGTEIAFGKIDAPLTQTLPLNFVFSGGDGNPQEGGDIFTVFDPAEGFAPNPPTVDEAVEPGDTVALFGKEVPGNREHEAARTVASVVDSTTLTVTRDFNPNNGAGPIVNDGFVIPWVVGRSQFGVVDSQANLGSQGRASVDLTYPISALGRPLVLWGQGDRVEPDVTKTVADVRAMVFPGIEPLRLTANPSSIQGNSTTLMELCLTDGLGAPINNVFIRGDVIEGPANGSLDGEPMPAVTGQPTGSAGAGCTVTELTTSGMVPEGDESTIRFSVHETFADVTVVPPGSAMLLVSPSRYTDPSPNIVSVPVLLTLQNAQGEPISGVSLTGECSVDGDGSLQIQQTPGVTDENGETTAVVAVGLTACAEADADGFPRTGTCQFTTSSGTPVGNFLAVGVNGTNSGVSPPCPTPDP
ncbi:MAG: hypothetical protein GVY32_12020 [Gammaproteobacteria bacterium]|nr:hypothetical protein [Gammaproteobacteria bacterium]